MADIQFYSEMRPTRIAWLGSIPASWQLRRLKYLFTIKKDIAGELGHTVLSVTQKGIRPKVMTDKGQFSQDYSKYQLVHEGDFVMNHMDLLTGWVDIAGQNGVTSPDYRVFTDKDPEQFLPEYYKYIFQLCYSARIFYGFGQGVAGFGRWRLPADSFLNFVLPIPSIGEQRTIAVYLAEKCAEIDSYIVEAQAGIEDAKQWKAAVIFEAITKGIDQDIPLRDSGIDWIGSIPVNWRLCPIKRLTLKIGSGKTPSGGAEVYTDEGVLFLRSQNIYDFGLVLDDVSHISDKIDAEMKNTRVQYKDVLLNITGGSIGRCCLYDLEGIRANVNQHVCILRAKQDELLPEFLRYFWNSSIGPVVVGYYQTGGNRQGLNFEQIGRVKIPLCSLETQRRIVEYLDERCSMLNDIIFEKQEHIRELEAYKHSLIYEAVTGKRKVV